MSTSTGKTTGIHTSRDKLLYLNFTEPGRIQSLPNELLCDIFTKAVEHDFLPQFGCTAHAISQTCQLWRKLALELQDLWSTIRISDKVHLGDWLLWLDRAGHKTLTCSVRLDRANNHIQDKCNAFLAALVKKQVQWRKIAIHHYVIPDSTSAEPLAFLLNNLPELETFYVRHEMPFITASGYEEFSDWDGFGVFQPLFIVPDNGLEIAAKLTSFVCEFNESNFLTREGLLSFLSDCWSITRLVIRHGIEIYNDGDLPDEENERGIDPDYPVDLYSLEHFTYQSYAAEGSLLDHINLPNLRSLDIRIDTFRSLNSLAEDRPSIVFSLESWQAPIEWASFEGGSFSDAESLRLLRALPHVKALSFVSTTSAPLEELTPTPGGETLCPQLQRLKYTSRGMVGAAQLQHFADARDQNFRAIVCSTEWNVVQLEVIKVDLGKLVANGTLQVVLAGSNEDLNVERRSWYAATEGVVGKCWPSSCVEA